MDEKTKKYMLYGLATVIALYALYMNPRTIAHNVVLYGLPLAVLAGIHYLILRRMLNTQFPLQPLLPQFLKSHNVSAARRTISTYSILIGLSYLTYGFIGMLMLMAGILPIQHQSIGKLADSLGKGVEGVDLFLGAIFMTAILLIFSKKFLAKPLNETWKAILVAGLIAGGASATLSYSLWTWIEPYLHITKDFK